MTNTQQVINITNVKVLIWYTGLSGRSAMTCLILVQNQNPSMNVPNHAFKIIFHFRIRDIMCYLLTNNALTLGNQRIRCYNYSELVKTRKNASFLPCMERLFASTIFGKKTSQYISFITIYVSTFALRIMVMG